MHKSIMKALGSLKFAILLECKLSLVERIKTNASYMERSSFELHIFVERVLGYKTCLDTKPV